MRKWSRILFVLMALAVIGEIAWLTLHPSEPTYKGKRLSEWLGDYDRRSSYLWPSVKFDDDFKAQNEAVRQLGTNAFPALLRRLQAKDSPLALWLAALAQKQDVFEFKYRPASLIRREGLYGFEVLGADGRRAVPELIRMYESHRPYYSYVVPAALSSIGPAADEAVPVLVRSLGDTNFCFCYTFRALGRIHSHPEIVLPVLEKYLRSRDSEERRFAADAIASYGLDAKRSVPFLLPLLGDSNAWVKSSATDALRSIDREALAKAEVK